MTKLHRFDREDGSFNSFLPSASFVARGHVVSMMAAIDDLSIYRELGADMLSVIQLCTAHMFVL